MAKIKVTAGAGRTVPVPTSIATAPGAQMLYLREGEELEVDDTDTHVQRTLADGDFVLVQPPALPPAPPSPAPATSSRAKAVTEIAKES